jgi:hypothetical protein
MDYWPDSPNAEVSASTMSRARVSRSDGDGAVWVTVEGEVEELACDVLLTSAVTAAGFQGGDEVLVWRQSSQPRGIVIGRVGRLAVNSMAAPEPAQDDGDAGTLPDELVIEARRSLTLRVGDGSITIREDGRILIRGRDLVSHAKRLNRIRGGSVTIN